MELPSFIDRGEGHVRDKYELLEYEVDLLNIVLLLPNWRKLVFLKKLWESPTVSKDVRERKSKASRKVVKQVMQDIAGLVKDEDIRTEIWNCGLKIMEASTAWQYLLVNRSSLSNAEGNRAAIKKQVKLLTIRYSHPERPNSVVSLSPLGLMNQNEMSHVGCLNVLRNIAKMLGWEETEEMRKGFDEFGKGEKVTKPPLFIVGDGGTVQTILTALGYRKKDLGGPLERLAFVTPIPGEFHICMAFTDMLVDMFWTPAAVVGTLGQYCADYKRIVSKKALSFQEREDILEEVFQCYTETFMEFLIFQAVTNDPHTYAADGTGSGLNDDGESMQAVAGLEEATAEMERLMMECRFLSEIFSMGEKDDIYLRGTRHIKAQEMYMTSAESRKAAKAFGDKARQSLDDEMKPDTKPKKVRKGKGARGKSKPESQEDTDVVVKTEEPSGDPTTSANPSQSNSKGVPSRLNPVEVGLSRSIQHGDGDAVIRMHKILLLYFKKNGRHKYLRQTAMEIADLLSVLDEQSSFISTQNRFANSDGERDSFLAMDLAMEHMIRIIKSSLGNIGTNLSFNHAHNISIAAFIADDLKRQWTKECGLKHGNQYHRSVQTDSDIEDFKKVTLERLKNPKQDHIPCDFGLTDAFDRLRSSTGEVQVIIDALKRNDRASLSAAMFDDVEGPEENLVAETSDGKEKDGGADIHEDEVVMNVEEVRQSIDDDINGLAHVGELATNYLMNVEDFIEETYREVVNIATMVEDIDF
ncbi:serine palmitoyltransferase, long chain base subunit [Phlyctochytrium bullatum]|nr:serine palmitoyltransferase, long chain base subunit [Phlyctochytrium bullatum]